ncbi:hypothetical protein C8Q80DRAFT_1309134 [Daedaleopsis nitida]|nr:hypothetical protein C8Q80DRAFT_1309134 [Daedaleopsis nitida]
MKSSVRALSPLIASLRSSHRTSLWLQPRLCLSARHSISSLGSLPKPIRLVQTPPSATSEQSIWRFVSSKVANATHRSGIGRTSRGGGYQGGGGSQGPWQSFRDRINSIPHNYIFWGIIGLNGAVYAVWNLAWVQYKSTGDPSSYMWMRHNFVSSAENLEAGRWYTLLTACFSHEDLMHIFFNTFTFYYMAPTVLAIIGNVSFLGLYLGGGIFSSLAGIAWRNYSLNSGQAQMSGSHGASGAIYSIISFYACGSPQTMFLLFGIIPLPAWAFVTGIFLYDGYSAVNQQRSKTDTAGHIGGLLAGIGYFVARRFRIF